MKQIVLAAALALALGGAAEARPINDKGMTVEEVSAWLKAAGFEPSILKTDKGEPYVRSVTKEGVNFDVDLYDCEDGRCRAVQFTTTFDVKEDLPVTKVNEWNRRKRYVRMYVDDDGDPVFQYDANVAPGGTFEALNDDFTLFLEFLPTMLEHIDW